MNNKSLYLKIAQLILFILIVGSLFQTFSLMRNHFTHVDDIGIANTFLKQEDFYNKSCENALSKKEDEILYRILLNSKKNICNFYFSYTIIPRTWTYAPFQFWFTKGFLNPEKKYTYEEVKWYGRLPSFLFNIIGLILFYFILKKKIYAFKNDLVVSLSLTLLVAFSLEQRIMSSQTHSYAIGLMSNCFALYAIFMLNRLKSLTNIQIVWTGLILATAISMQYQALLLVFSGMISVFIINLNNIKSWRWLKKYTTLCVSLALGFLLTAAFLVLKHVDRGINWNAGKNKEFIISSVHISEKLLEFSTLIWSKSAYNFYSIISSIEFENSFSANLLGAIFLTLFFLGFIFLLIKSNISENRFLLLILSIYIVLYLILVFFGYLAYSPTRHFLYYLPIIIIVMGHGLLLLKPKKYSNIFDIILITLIILYSISSLKLFTDFEKKRFDLNSLYNVPAIYFNSKSDQILLDRYDYEPLFMPELRNQHISIYSPKSLCDDYIAKLTLVSKNPIKIFWYSKRLELNSKGDSLLVDDLEHVSIKDYFLKIIKNCHPDKIIKNDSVIVKKSSDILIHKSNTEIDLSNLTKNGANELFLQAFEVKFSDLSN